MAATKKTTAKRAPPKPAPKAKPKRLGKPAKKKTAKAAATPAPASGSPIRNRSDRVIRFCEKFIRVPEGALVGQRIQLDEFQKKFIRDVYDDARLVRRAILSMARKNAKTALIAMLVLAHLVGPEAVQNSRIISGAMSKEQAAEVFTYAKKMVELSPELTQIITIVESKSMLIGLTMGVEYRAISAEGKTAHGKSPILAILDEVGQIKGPKNRFFDAITTSQGAHKNPLQIIISTQAEEDGDLLSLMIDDAIKNPTPGVVCHLYTAPKDCDLMDRAAWKAANPALGKFRDEKDLHDQCDEARRMPSREGTVRNLLLNQRVAYNSVFISRSAWKACSGVCPPIEYCTEIYGGIDLSSRTDLTTFVLYGLYEGVWYAYCWCWTPEIGLLERAKKDRTPYEDWVKSGHLITVPGASIDYEFVAKQMVEIVLELPAYGGSAYDRWRIDLLKKEISKITSEDLKLEPWGQGFKDMSPALDAIEEKILNLKFCHGDHPLLTMAAANAVVTKDPAGGRKLDKSKVTGRIDPLVALTMAAGLAERVHEDTGNFDEYLNSPLVMSLGKR